MTENVKIENMKENKETFITANTISLEVSLRKFPKLSFTKFKEFKDRQLIELKDLKGIIRDPNKFSSFFVQLNPDSPNTSLALENLALKPEDIVIHEFNPNFSTEKEEIKNLVSYLKYMTDMKATLVSVIKERNRLKKLNSELKKKYEIEKIEEIERKRKSERMSEGRVKYESKSIDSSYISSMAEMSGIRLQKTLDAVERIFQMKQEELNNSKVISENLSKKIQDVEVRKAKKLEEKTKRVKTENEKLQIKKERIQEKLNDELRERNNLQNDLLKDKNSYLKIKKIKEEEFNKNLCLKYMKKSLEEEELNNLKSKENEKDFQERQMSLKRIEESILMKHKKAQLQFNSKSSNLQEKSKKVKNVLLAAKSLDEQNFAKAIENHLEGFAGKYQRSQRMRQGHLNQISLTMKQKSKPKQLKEDSENELKQNSAREIVFKLPPHSTHFRTFEQRFENVKLRNQKIEKMKDQKLSSYFSKLNEKTAKLRKFREEKDEQMNEVQKNTVYISNYRRQLLDKIK